MLAGSAILYFHERAKEARQSAINLKDAVVETSEALMRLSLNQLNVKQFDLEDQYENQVVQRALLMNAENYQKQRLDLAAQYSPAQETLRKEQEVSQDLAELFKARLLTEKDYQTARITLARDTRDDYAGTKPA